MPITGLPAAGADAVFHRAYAGGLAAALVLGLQAAATARVGGFGHGRRIAP